MIHAITQELAAALRAKNVPVKVVDGPERAPSNLNERIVVELDLDGGDSFAPARSQRSNPKSRMTHGIGTVARIFAKHPASGATIQEHNRRAYMVLDRVIACLDDVVRGRGNLWAPSGGKFVRPTDIEGSETWPGAVYEFRFAVSRSVLDRTWPVAEAPDGEARPEVTFGDPDGPSGIVNELHLSVAGGDEEVIPFGATG